MLLGHHVLTNTYRFSSVDVCHTAHAWTAAAAAAAATVPALWEKNDGIAWCVLHAVEN